MIKAKKYALSIALLLALILTTFYFLFRDNEIGALITVIKGSKPLYLVLGMFLMLLSIAGEGFCIMVVMRSFKYRPTFMKCLFYSFVGFYYSSITPSSSGGQPMQVYYMKRDGLDLSSSTLSIMVATIAYQVGMLLLCIVSLMFRFNLISQNLGAIKYFSILGVSIIVIVISIFVATTFHSTFLESLSSGVVSLLSKLRIVKKREELAEKMRSGISEYRNGALYLKRNPKILLISLAGILVKIVARLSVAYAVYKAFSLSGFSYFDILALQILLAVGVEFMPLPGAVGATEAGFLAVNSRIFGAEKLMPALLLSRGISFYAFMIISGLITLLGHVPRKLREKSAAEIK